MAPARKAPPNLLSDLPDLPATQVVQQPTLTANLVTVGANGVARFDGTSWAALGSSLGGEHTQEVLGELGIKAPRAGAPATTARNGLV